MGWIFPASDIEEPGAEPDPLNGAKNIRELYELASTNYSGRYSVPVCAAADSKFYLMDLHILLNYIELFR